MPNPLGGRRSLVNNEVEALKKELETLRENYARDMALISEDIKSLSTQLPGSPKAK
jgi:hypothetical protein